MTLNVSNYLADALLNQVFRNIAYVQPPVVFVALYTSNPTAADTGIEVSGGAYARQVVQYAAPVTEAGKRTLKNNAEIVFPIATADWGLITHIGIRDAEAAGNLLYFGSITNEKSILSGDRLRTQQDAIATTLS